MKTIHFDREWCPFRIFYIGNTPFANLKHNIKDKVSNSWFKFLQKLDKILKESTKKFYWLCIDNVVYFIEILFAFFFFFGLIYKSIFGSLCSLILETITKVSNKQRIIAIFTFNCVLYSYWSCFKLCKSLLLMQMYTGLRGFSFLKYINNYQNCSYTKCSRLKLILQSFQLLIHWFTLNFP